MSVQGLLRQSGDIARRQAVGTNGRYDMAPLYQGIRCIVMPMSTQAVVDNGFSVGQSFDAFFAASQDVQVGDKLTVDGRSYIVKGLQPYAGMSSAVDHVKAVVVTEKANG